MLPNDHVHFESFPEVLNRFVAGRHANDVSSLRVILVPLRSSKDSLKDIDTSLSESVLTCMRNLNKFCVKNHLSKFKSANHGHSCMVELLQPPKTPALSIASYQLDMITDKDLVNTLETECGKTCAIYSAVGRFKQHRRMICHTSKEICYLNPKDEHYLRNFKVLNGERGNMNNIKDLLYLAGNLRRTFTTFIVGIASVRYSEMRTAPYYKFLLENGPYVNPTYEDSGEQSKRGRSSSTHRNAPSKQRRGNKSKSEERDLRNRLNMNARR